jgi:hypothetical protein
LKYASIHLLAWRIRAAIWGAQSVILKQQMMSSREQFFKRIKAAIEPRIALGARARRARRLGVMSAARDRQGPAQFAQRVLLAHGI